jgi:hypothetical protein
MSEGRWDELAIGSLEWISDLEDQSELLTFHARRSRSSSKPQIHSSRALPGLQVLNHI